MGRVRSLKRQRTEFKPAQKVPPSTGRVSPRAAGEKDSRDGRDGEFDLTPDPRILQMLGEINLEPWRCVAELVDNSVDAFMSWSKAGVMREKPEGHVRLPLVNDARAQVVVRDNGPGMSSERLEQAIRAGWSGNEPLAALGMFGMGFNIATARLGTITEVWTTRPGDAYWVGAFVDFDQLQRKRTFRTPRRYTEKAGPNEHGTEIIIKKLKPEQLQWFARSANRNKLVANLSRAYSSMLMPSGTPLELRLYVNDQAVEPKRHCVWSAPSNAPRVVDTPRFGPVDAYQPIEVRLGERRYCVQCWQWLAADSEICPECGTSEHVLKRDRVIRGWLGVQRYLHQSEYGIDFIRHGRKIELGSKDLFLWNNGDRMEKEYPIDDPRDRGRIVGEIHIDHCRVSYMKDRFDRNDPAWDEMVKAVRGDDPLRPDVARTLGRQFNQSPLAKLFQVFRRSTPKPKVAGAWAKLLVVPDNDKAEDYAARFHKGDPEFQTDERWYELILEEDRRLLTKSPSSPAATDGQGSGDSPLAGFQTGEGEAAAPPTPAAEAPRQEVKGLSNSYVCQITGRRWPLKAYSVKQDHPELRNGVAWTLRALPTGEFEFYVNEEHDIFRSATMTPLDALLSELAWQQMDEFRDAPGDRTFAEVLADLRENYATRVALDPVVLANEAKQTLSAIAASFAQGIDDRDAVALFEGLSKEDQESIWRNIATRGAGLAQVNVDRRDFLEYAPPNVLLQVFEQNPEMFLDGKCWDDKYSTLEYESGAATQIAKELVVRDYRAMLADVVWLAEKDSDDLARAPRAKLLRAMYALELVTPTRPTANGGGTS